MKPQVHPQNTEFYKRPDSPQKKFFIILSVFLVALVAFSPSLNRTFFLDDFLHLERSSRLTATSLLKSWELKPADVRAYWWVPPEIEIKYFRPVITFLFWLDQRLWSRSPLGFHLTNLFFHFLSSWLVYQIGLLIFRKKKMAFWPFFFFLLHPIHIGAVQWISGRTDVVMTFFYLLAFYLYLAMRISGSARASYIIGMAFSFALALLTKESAVSFPAVVLLSNFLLLPEMQGLRSGSKKAAAALVIVFMLLSVYIILRIPHLAIPRLPDPYFVLPRLQSLPLIILRYLLYLFSCLFLLPVFPFHNAEGWLRHTVLLSILGSFLLIICFITGKRLIKNKVFLFFLAWFLLALIPSLPIMMGGRLAYLSSVGFCFMLAIFLWPGKSPHRGVNLRKKTAQILSAAIIILYCINMAIQGHLANSLARQNNQFIQKIIGLAKAEDRSELFLINAPMPASLWISQAARFLAGNSRLELTVLSLSPVFIPESLKASDPVAYYFFSWFYSDRPGSSLQIRKADINTLVLEDTKGFFDSPTEKFFLVGRSSFAVNEMIVADEFCVRVTKIDERGTPKQLQFRFHRPIRERRYLFLFCDGFEVYALD